MCSGRAFGPLLEAWLTLCPSLAMPCSPQGHARMMRSSQALLVIGNALPMCSARMHPQHVIALQPEFSHNVQTYEQSVYLRVQDAQRCRIHSTMLLPLYMTPQRDHPFAVFEVCQSEKNVMFPSLVDLLQRCLEVSFALALVGAVQTGVCFTSESHGLQGPVR